MLLVFSIFTKNISFAVLFFQSEKKKILLNKTDRDTRRY